MILSVWRCTNTNLIDPHGSFGSTCVPPPPGEPEMRPKIPSETQNTSKDHLFSIEISRNVERQKTLVFDLDFEKNVAVATPTHPGHFLQ